MIIYTDDDRGHEDSVEAAWADEQGDIRHLTAYFACYRVWVKGYGNTRALAAANLAEALDALAEAVAAARAEAKQEAALRAPTGPEADPSPSPFIPESHACP